MLRSAGIRFVIVGVLVILMFVPLFFVGAVIDSRASYSREAIQDVGREWGGPQVLSGPVLIVPVEGPVTRVESRDIANEDGTTRTERFEVTEVQRKAPLYIFPETFDLRVDIATTVRSRGIFEVPVYAADVVADMGFDLDVRAALGSDERVLWESAVLRASLSSNRALRGEAALTVDGAARALEPVTGGNRAASGITARVGDPRQAERFRLTLGLNGAERFFAAPVGRSSSVTMTSDWPHPSFTGAFLPDGSTVSDDGFEATWTIPHLARPIPQVAREDLDRTVRTDAAFGVRLFQPNDFYQQAYRAARYGILFIALTFLTVLLTERKDRRPTHPVQYILIGLAQSIFVLLMVAYAEQIGFGPAYALSAGATIAAIVMFGATALKLGRRTLVLGAMLILTYGVLYLILRSTDYALLAGATVSFVALVGTMYATRNEDWYGKPKAPAPDEEDAAASEEASPAP